MIIWISSYPKSGNTWLRLFIINYLFPEQKNVFDNLAYIPEYPKKFFFEGFYTKEDFKAEQVNLYKYFISSQNKINLNKEINFLKTHSFAATIDNYKFTNKENTAGFVYIVRDPRSVVISHAFHSNKSYEKAAEIIIREKNVAIDNDKIITLRTSWKMNYLSWIKSPYPRILVKYEELINDPFTIFKKILEFINGYKKIDISDKKILNTIEKCNFDNLKLEEEKKGFIEKMGRESFFRKGQTDEWKNVLSKDLISKIEKEFGTEMKELGYL